MNARCNALRAGFRESFHLQLLSAKHQNRGRQKYNAVCKGAPERPNQLAEQEANSYANSQGHKDQRESDDGAYDAFGMQCNQRSKTNYYRDRSSNQSHRGHRPWSNEGNRCADDQREQQKHDFTHAIASREAPEKKSKKVVYESCSNPR